MSQKGYHKLKITKHNYNSPMKLLEESLEYLDAIAQGNKIMASVELSDLLGAVLQQAEILNITLDDLIVMSKTTQRVFQNGRRNNSSLFEYLKENHDKILDFGLGFIQVKVQNVNYNFYTQNIKKFDNSEAPHSHQQDFISEVLCGELVETVYKIDSGDLDAYCGCGDTEATVEAKYSYKVSEVISHKEKDVYVRTSGEFHSVCAKENTVTKVMKFGNKSDAIVIGTNSKYASIIDESELWNIVWEICNKNDL